MKYTVDFNVYEFPFWSGGKTWADFFFKEGKEDLLAEKIEEFAELFDGVPSATDINDYVWTDDELHGLLDAFREDDQV